MLNAFTFNFSRLLIATSPHVDHIVKYYAKDFDAVSASRELEEAKLIISLPQAKTLEELTEDVNPQDAVESQLSTKEIVEPKAVPSKRGRKPGGKKMEPVVDVSEQV